MSLPDLQKAEPLFREYNVGFAGVFGSYARGEQTATSDLDLLVKYLKVPGFFKLVELEQQLSALFNVHVDLVTENAVSPHILPYVLKDLRPIYGQQ